MSASAWDELFQPGSRRQEQGARQHWIPAFLRSWEEWLTLLILSVLLLAVVASIEAANWASEMPSLAAAAVVGLAAGWLLSRVPLPGLPLHVPGIAIGVATAVVEVLQTIEVADPLTNPGLRGRWDEMWARIGAWFEALIGGGVSSDPLPFVLLMVLATWSVAYFAAWAVFRWHSPWLALAPAGFALLTNISYLPGQPSRWFVVFLFAAVLLFSRLYLLRRVDTVEGAARPSLLSLEVLNATWWLGLLLVVLAWVIPSGQGLGVLAERWEESLRPVTERFDGFGRLFVGIDAKHDRRIHSFSDTLPLQGQVSLDDEVMMFVDAPEPVYLRLATFDQYEAAGWRASAGGEIEPEALSPELREAGSEATRAQFRRPIVLSVQVEEAFQDRRLLVAGEPLASDVPAQVVTGAAPLDRLGLQPEERLRAGDAYTTVGAVSAAPIERLLEAGSNYPAWVRDRYLQLPDDLPPEIAQLAVEVTAEAGEPYLRARLIEQFLRDHYAVEFDLPTRPPRADAVAHFLFETQAGYFDYHASAMAVLLRTLGVPSRVAVGFALDESQQDAVTKSYIVSEEQAWAWPEVYFPDYGWIPFNPTPNRAALTPPGDEQEFLDSVGGLGPVTPVDPLDNVQDELLFGQEIDPDVLAELEAEAQGSSGLESRVGLLGLVLGIMLASAAVVSLVGWWSWTRPLRGLSPAASRWTRVLRLAGWAGVRISESRTPLEVADLLRRRLALSTNLAPLARAYGRERYGPPRLEQWVLDPDRGVDFEERYIAARNELLKRSLRRLWPFGRGAVSGRPARSAAPEAPAGRS